MRNAVNKLTSLLQSAPRLVVHWAKLTPKLPGVIWLGLQELGSFSLFIGLILVYLLRSSLVLLGRFGFVRRVFLPLAKPLDRLYLRLVRRFQIHDHGSINSLDIIMLAVSHLKVKKSRTIIAIGGMAIGFGAVVFLLSLGYGAERLVVSKVARLDELKQTDITTGKATSLFITDNTLVDMKKIPHVKMVLPMISVVSKVSYNNSVSDVVAYAVSSEFLNQSAIRPTKGDIFDSPLPDISQLLRSQDMVSAGQVAGAEVTYVEGVKANQEICQAQFELEPLVWKPVYRAASPRSEVLGYTRREANEQAGTELWGEDYSEDPEGDIGIDDHQNHYGRWIESSFLIWQKTDCEPVQPDCVDGRYRVEFNNNRQVMVQGFITKADVSSQCYRVVDLSVADIGDELSLVKAKTATDEYVPVYRALNNDSLPIGYTQLNQFTPLTLVWGEQYLDGQGWGRSGHNAQEQPVGLWVKGEFGLWQKLDCQGCNQQFLERQDERGKQVVSSGYIKLSHLLLADETQLPALGQVLGVSTTDASASQSASESDEADDELAVAEAEVGWVEIASVSATTQEEEVPPLKLPDQAKKQAVVNKAMIKLMGLSESDAVGKTFMASFVFNENLFTNQGKQRESEPVSYTIIGIIPGDKTPTFYLPFDDLKGVGVTSYPQVKLVVDKRNALTDVRSKIESLGFKTSSVVDTVDRINSLFGNIRLALTLLGMIALGVAALGMFNTLTVSLMERTREVGLMKAMGMSTHEVKRLFLTESVVMGIIGGVFGLLFGVGLGKLTSLLISTISVSKGLGFLDVTYIPLALVVTILVLSFIIGVFTGFFPARRATKISALDALRYE